MEQNEYVDAKDSIIISIPNDVVKLEITATILDKNDKVTQCSMTLGVQDLIEARILGEEWEYENVKYMLTDKAKSELGGG